MPTKATSLFPCNARALELAANRGKKGFSTVAGRESAIQTALARKGSMQETEAESVRRLVLPLAPLAALAGAFVVLALGHYASLNAPRVQRRWRFTAERSRVRRCCRSSCYSAPGPWSSIPAGWSWRRTRATRSDRR